MTADADVEQVTIIEEIAAERERQIEQEGWSIDHDNEHSKGEIAMAAACYAHPERIFIINEVCGRGYESYPRFEDAWPWDDVWWKPKDRRRDLIRAAALLVAEIERLDRV